MAHPARKKKRWDPSRSRSPGVPGGGGALSVFDPLCEDTVRCQGRDVMSTGDPLEAERWMSYLLGMYSGLQLIGEPDPATAIGGRLVKVATRLATPEALMCLRAIQAVAGPALARQAKKALASLAGRQDRAPAWIHMIGSAQATSAWRATDDWGSQDSLMVGFAYPAADFTTPEHCLLVLVDHLLDGIAKDLAIVPLDAALGFWQGMRLTEEKPSAVAAGILDAMAVTDRENPPVDQDYLDGIALLRARMGQIASEGDLPLPTLAEGALSRSPGLSGQNSACHEGPKDFFPTLPEPPEFCRYPSVISPV